MKHFTSCWKNVVGAGVMLAIVAMAATGTAEDKTTKPKPYPLKTCLVSGEQLGGMGDPYVFTHQGQEIKLCCKSCLKSFNKEPAKYLKKLEEGDKTNAKTDNAPAKGHGGHQH